MNIGEHRHCCATLISKYKDFYGKKPIVSVTYENESISIKTILPYIKCVLRLSCVVHGPIYGLYRQQPPPPKPGKNALGTRLHCKRFSLYINVYQAW